MKKLTKEELKDSIFTALRREFDSSQNKLRLIEIYNTTFQLGYLDEALEMYNDLIIEEIIKLK